MLPRQSACAPRKHSSTHTRSGLPPTLIHSAQNWPGCSRHTSSARRTRPCASARADLVASIACSICVRASAGGEDEGVRGLAHPRQPFVSHSLFGRCDLLRELVQQLLAMHLAQRGASLGFSAWPSRITTTTTTTTTTTRCHGKLGAANFWRRVSSQPDSEIAGGRAGRLTSAARGRPRLRARLCAPWQPAASGAGRY